MRKIIKILFVTCVVTGLFGCAGSQKEQRTVCKSSMSYFGCTISSIIEYNHKEDNIIISRNQDTVIKAKNKEVYNVLKEKYKSLDLSSRFNRSEGIK